MIAQQQVAQQQQFQEAQQQNLVSFAEFLRYRQFMARMQEDAAAQVCPYTNCGCGRGRNRNFRPPQNRFRYRRNGYRR